MYYRTAVNIEEVLAAIIRIFIAKMDINHGKGVILGHCQSFLGESLCLEK